MKKSNFESGSEVRTVFISTRDSSSADVILQTADIRIMVPNTAQRSSLALKWINGDDDCDFCISLKV